MFIKCCNMRDIVLVKGNIIGKSGNHVIKGWVALASCEIEKDAVEVIEGDLFLDKNYSTKPYYIYVSTGEVTAIANNCICVLPHPSMVLKLYKDEIGKIHELMNVPVPEHLKSTYYRQQYIDVIGSIELFISELMSCLVLGQKDFYDAFISNSAYKIPLNKIEECANNMQKTIYKLIHSEVSHRLDKMEEIYHGVFNVDFPPLGKISEKIKTRHDLVHRNGFQVKDKSLKYVNISAEDILSLINVSNEFVDALYMSFENKGIITRWNDDSAWINAENCTT